MPSFNLIGEPWIPCYLPGRQTPELLSLQDALLKSPEVVSVNDASPLVTVALHRLLLAILHRSLWAGRGYGPASEDEWLAVWRRGSWDPAAIRAYLERWRDRFDLFSECNPFYQVASLDFSRAGSVARLRFQMDANPTLFDHTLNGSDLTVTTVQEELTPAETTCRLLAYQAFDVGGTKTAERGQESANAALLNRPAVCLAQGAHLFQTLMLNLHWYSREGGEPFPSQPDDCPAWEREQETRPIDRRPAGYLDLLTWQSRRIRLRPDTAEDKRLVVRQAVVMKGYQLPKRVYLRAFETMAAFRKRKKPQPGEEPWSPVRFAEDRALWRDSLALLQSVGEERERPKMLTWLNDLSEKGVKDFPSTIPLDFLGISTDRARVEFWRHERLPLPLAYLHDDVLVGKLGDALGSAEKTEEALNDATREAAKHLTITADKLGNPGQQSSRAEKNKIRDLAESLGSERAYWAQLEVLFKRVMVGLANDWQQAPDDDAKEKAAESHLRLWARELSGAARRAFGTACSGLDGSARGLQAVAIAERALDVGLRRTLGQWLDVPEIVEEEETNTEGGDR